MTMFERRLTLSAFARGTAGYTKGADELCDDVVLAHHTGHLPNNAGLDANKRHFVDLLFHYALECERAHAERQAKLARA